MRAIIGLGNPGSRYARTRHNIGFMVVDALAAAHGGRWASWPTYMMAVVETAGARARLIKPQTYMNASGEAVAAIEASGDAAREDILVVCDDVYLSLGKGRLRMRGSSGGHRGLESVARALDSTDFIRLRLGVGPVPAHADLEGYVLSEFAPEERPVLDYMIEQAAALIRQVLIDGLEKAVSRFEWGAPPALRDLEWE